MSNEKKETLDFSDLDSKTAAETGTVMEVDDPRNDEKLTDPEGKPYWIELIGTDSAKLKAISRKFIDRRVNGIRKGKNEDFDSDTADQERVQLYAAATKSWYLLPIDGEALECNEKNAKRLYSDARFPWLVEQIDKAIADRKRFFKKASPR